jgi:hypothetical protein
MNVKKEEKQVAKVVTVFNASVGGTPLTGLFPLHL